MEQIASEILTPGQKNTTFPVEGREEGHGYLTKPQQESKIGLILIQEWWGLNQSLCITADKFSAKGFVVLVPDVYRGKCAKDREVNYQINNIYVKTQTAGHYFKDLEWDGAVKDMIAAGQYLKNKLGCTKVGIIGFCLGGALVYAALSASQGTFDAGAPFYGICDQTKYPLKNIKVPVQAHFAEKDTAKGFADPESAKKLDQEAKDLHLDYQTIIWEGADHAFMNQNSTRYNPEVAQKALDESCSFFQKKLSC